QFIGREIGQLLPTGYRQVQMKEGSFLVHRLVWLYVCGSWPSDEIDHVNTNRSDNRFENLREANRTQNNANRRAQKGRKLKGITFHRGRKRWQAQIQKNGRNVYL